MPRTSPMTSHQQRAEWSEDALHGLQNVESLIRSIEISLIGDGQVTASEAWQTLATALSVISVTAKKLAR